MVHPQDQQQRWQQWQKKKKKKNTAQHSDNIDFFAIRLYAYRLRGAILWKIIMISRAFKRKVCFKVKKK